MTPVELLLSKLPEARRNRQGWQARCPAHHDRTPSLSIAEGDDGRALIKCHAGCTPQAIVQAIDLGLVDLMPENNAKGRTNVAGRHRQPASAPGVSRMPSNTFPTAKEAVAVLERQHGEPSASWCYRDTTGRPVSYVVRWDRSGGKMIRPVSRTPQGDWAIGGMAEPRPLYGLPDLVNAPAGSRVYICEGEKAADAARALGLTATTSAHGSKSASKTDWSPLAGREVFILPDADEAGEGYAEDVVGLLADLSPAPRVKVVRLPKLPFGDGGDLDDFLVLRGGDVEAVKAEVEALADAADTVTPFVTADNLTKLTKPASKAFLPFPVEALPQAFRGFVGECAQTIGCDPSFIALPLLVGFASAIGNSRCIQIKQAWSEPAILWAAIIGESGSTKSPALELALRPLRERQREAMRQHAEAVRTYEAQMLTHERDVSQWKRSTSDGLPPETPGPPICERCWTDDATIEAVANLLQDNPRGMLVIRDELAGWLNFDRYSSNGKSGGAAKWLEMFGGRALVVDRKTSGTIYVPRASVSVIGGIQPGILGRYVGQEHRENGLLARLLLTMPPRRQKFWTEADIDPKSEAAIADVFSALYDLRPASNAVDEPQPAMVPLSRDGRRAWIEFYNEHNAEAFELCGDLAAAWSKLEGYAARFALVHHLIRQVTGEGVGNGVDAVSVGAGAQLSRWFAHEARRVYAMLGEGEDARERRQLAELIQRKGGSVTVREWQRVRSHRTSEDAEAELATLVSAGAGRWDHIAAGPKGGRPSKKLVLNIPDECVSPEPSAALASGDESFEAGGELKGAGTGEDKEWWEL